MLHRIGNILYEDRLNYSKHDVNFICDSPPANSASLIGDTVDAGIYLGSNDTRVNGFGLDSPYVVASGASDLKQYSDVFALDVEQDGFVIDYNVQGTRGWAGYFKISDLDFGSGIAAVSIDTNAVNWDLSNMLIFDSSTVTSR